MTMGRFESCLKRRTHAFYDPSKCHSKKTLPIKPTLTITDPELIKKITKQAAGISAQRDGASFSPLDFLISAANKEVERLEIEQIAACRRIGVDDEVFYSDDFKVPDSLAFRLLLRDSARYERWVCP